MLSSKLIVDLFNSFDSVSGSAQAAQLTVTATAAEASSSLRQLREPARKVYSMSAAASEIDIVPLITCCGLGDSVYAVQLVGIDHTLNQSART